MQRMKLELYVLTMVSYLTSAFLKSWHTTAPSLVPLMAGRDSPSVVDCTLLVETIECLPEAQGLIDKIS
jgi:hypothetical protein